MGYINLTILKMLNMIHSRDIFLPAFQREYVWNPNKVEKLFDSIMCGYPINSFLLWKVKRENNKNYPAYEFIREFDEDNPHPEEAYLTLDNKDINLVIDGQQRITSIYIALCGTYKSSGHKKRSLYLNLLWEKSNEDSNETNYQFLFKEDGSSLKKGNLKQLWYKVGDILDNIETVKNSIKNEPQYLTLDKKDKKRAMNTLSTLYNSIHRRKNINVYEEVANYDRALDIFIRTNTGGQKLNYSDILFSTITAGWRDSQNARKEVDELIKNMNGIGDYKFDRDFVMKAIVYLNDDLPIKYKIDSFTRDKIECVEKNWETNKNALLNCIKIVYRYGFTTKALTSKLVLLPIAQYLKNKPNRYINSSKKDDVEDQNNIRKWIIIMLLKQGFGSSTDTILSNIRPLVQNSKDKFPYQEICRKLNITFDDNDVNDLLLHQYKGKYTYLILSILYPDRTWANVKYYEDHIHPQKQINDDNLWKENFKFTDAEIKEYKRKGNSILNLELLEDSENSSKKDKTLKEWMENSHTDFSKIHHIPQMNDYDFKYFPEFITEREKLLKEKLKFLITTK